MKSTRKIIFLALMVGCGIMLQIIESFVPVVIFVPGFKIGFANIVSLLTLMLWDIPSMWCVALLRIVLASLMMGTIMLILGNLIADILLMITDPRLRRGGE